MWLLHGDLTGRSGAEIGFQSYPKYRQGALASQTLHHPVFGHRPLHTRVLALANRQLLVSKATSSMGLALRVSNMIFPAVGCIGLKCLP